MKNLSRIVLSACLLWALASAANAAEGGETDCAAKLDARVISRYIFFQDCWGSDLANEKHRYLNEMYVRPVIRIRLSDLSPRATVRSYPHKNLIDWLVRTDESTSDIIVVRITTSDPSMSYTVPLVSLAYDGKLNVGEGWVTSVSQADTAAPFFRITPTSTVTYQAEIKSTKKADSRTAANVLGLVQQALQIAAPQAKLLTTISKPQIESFAKATDTVVSAISSDSVTESVQIAKPLDEWYPRASILLNISLPERVRLMRVEPDGKETDLSEAIKDRTLVFELVLTCPRLSMFDSVDVCETAPGQDSLTRTRSSVGSGGEAFKGAMNGFSRRVSASQVLNFDVAGGKTIRQHITDQKWYSTFVQDISVSDTQSDLVGPANLTAKNAGTLTFERKRDQFCITVANELYDIGLSHFDAGVGLWAVVVGLPELEPFREKFSKSATCKGLIPLEELKAGLNPTAAQTTEP